MERSLVALVSLAFAVALASPAFAVELDGQWDISVTSDDYSSGSLVGTTSGSAVIVIRNTLEGSNDFVGELVYEGQVQGTVRGRIIKASTPYTRDVVVFERVDLVQNYFQVCIGLLSGDRAILQGHAVDTFGNSSHFEMRKR